MSAPVRVRARLSNGLAEVALLMPHPMETGLRAGADGKAVPAHYITEVEVRVAGRLALVARTGFALAQDPLISFHCKGLQPGDRVSVGWLDNRGERGHGEALVA